jgi:hypothetical protein
MREMTCAAAIRLPKDSSPYLKSYSNNYENRMILITGHIDGYVNYFTNFQSSSKQEVSRYYNENAIVNIASFRYGLIITTEASKLHLVDFSLKNSIKDIDMTAFSFKLVNYDIADVLVTDTWSGEKQKLLVSTKNGDIVEIKF